MSKSTNRPQFTVITVTYNAGKTIQRTLDSVAEQTLDDIEHLIIDGCSTDCTMQLIQRYVELNADREIPRAINLIREPDEGLYDAMNKGLQAAKGEYVLFLNAGDKLHEPNTLELAASHLAKFNSSRHPAILYGETDWVDDAGRFLRHRRLKAPEQLTSRSFLWGMLICHQSFYVRADIARSKPYNLAWHFSADYDWCIRIMQLAERRGLAMYNTGLILTDYLAEGLTTRNHRRSLMERLRIMAHHYGWLSAIAAHLWFCIRAVIKK
ncbi:MAG: glycosyltransferase [Bacteroidaceae bacterium]|nr:glycosyltransferase [Bacteroidaceae bacterium]